MTMFLYLFTNNYFKQREKIYIYILVKILMDSWNAYARCVCAASGIQAQ